MGIITDTGDVTKMFDVQIERLPKTQEHIVLAQAEIVKDNYVKEYGKHKKYSRTGELVKGIKISKVGDLTVREGKIVNVYVENKDRENIRNIYKQLAMEYGTYKTAEGTYYQKPTPVIKPAEDKSKPAMKTVSEEIMEKEQIGEYGE